MLDVREAMAGKVLKYWTASQAQHLQSIMIKIKGLKGMVAAKSLKQEHISRHQAAKSSISSDSRSSIQISHKPFVDNYSIKTCRAHTSAFIKTHHGPQSTFVHEGITMLRM